MKQPLTRVEELTKMPPPATAGQLCIKSHYVSPDTKNADVINLFSTYHAVFLLPVVEDERPIGMINRSFFFTQISRNFYRDIYEKKSCTTFMDKNPLIIDCNCSIQNASSKFIEYFDKFLEGGFIITNNTKYMGIGYVIDFIKYISDLNAEMNQKLEAVVKELDFKANHDDLTGVYNRAAFISKFNELRSTSAGTLVLFDIDDFKSINDTFGHPMGDAVIKEIITMIKKILPDNSIIGRFGGDEFGFLIEELEERHIRYIIQKIMYNFHTTPLTCIPERFITISVGIMISAVDVNFENIYHITDTALYHAKKQGRNRVILAEIINGSENVNYKEFLFF
ncbi:GGDEF domain-containing protein [Acerihabitans sp. TG2]|uniref:GGDEF domain-containing protein n=1 Tax=Acerihabitans sp. TG2 TaxID=3096008 RepID=UPI002B23C4BE|nr:GGDEF domain-containing protein [Acerihabitans sp. TG2]MEA9389982.1 GGDEF domain-containing protein [Acerihabitans sp. TG2]